MELEVKVEEVLQPDDIYVKLSGDKPPSVPSNLTYSTRNCSKSCGLDAEQTKRVTPNTKGL